MRAVIAAPSLDGELTMATDITENSTITDELNYLTDEVDTPKRASVDGVDITNRSLKEQIAEIRFKRSSRIMSYGLGACFIHQARPPNAIGTNTGTS